MSRLLAALAWSGRDIMLSLFVAFPRGGPSSILRPDVAPSPSAVHFYELKDVDNGLPGLTCVELDLVYEEPPPDLANLVTAWLQAALDAGSPVAWFAFEGSFDFNHILTADIADQVFAVATTDGVELGLIDADREGPAWASRLEAARSRARL